ncbi:hypothetical protein LDENG_00210290, partial [Lucifuga dentata]
MPLPTDGEPVTEDHDCVAAVEQVCTPRPDLISTPLLNSDLVLFVDGSTSKAEDGTTNVGYAVCSAHDTLKSNKLPSRFSAQAAELVALTEACKLAEGK